MIKKLFIFVSLMVSSFLYADEIQFVTGLSTWHYYDNYYDGHYNNNNHLVGVRYKSSEYPVYLELATFRNSFYRNSYAFGIANDYELDRVYQYSFYTGFSATLVNGYKVGEIFDIPLNKDVHFVVAPYIKFMYDDKVGLQHRVMGVAGTLEVVFAYKF